MTDSKNKTSRVAARAPTARVELGEPSMLPAAKGIGGDKTSLALFRKLRAAEITSRLVDVTAEGGTLLLYAKASAVAQILDDSVGKLGWSMEHRNVGNMVFCRVGIFDDMENQTMWRSDVGTPMGNFEPEKTAAHDAFKRAARLWGIGAELTTLPKIKVPVECCDNVPHDGQTAILTNVYTLETITYEVDFIASLVIVSREGKKFTWTRNGQ